MIEVELRYFASLRSQSGLDHERVQIEDANAEKLYLQLKTRYGWRFDVAAIRLAVNGQMVSWDQPLLNGDEVVFLPPFSGG